MNITDPPTIIETVDCASSKPSENHIPVRLDPEADDRAAHEFSVASADQEFSVGLLLLGLFFGAGDRRPSSRGRQAGGVDASGVGAGSIIRMDRPWIHRGRGARGRNEFARLGGQRFTRRRGGGGGIVLRGLVFLLLFAIVEAHLFRYPEQVVCMCVRNCEGTKFCPISNFEQFKLLSHCTT